MRRRAEHHARQRGNLQAADLGHHVDGVMRVWSVHRQRALDRAAPAIDIA